MVSTLRERGERRKPLIYPAWIEQEGNSGPLRCFVSNESEQSAQITTVADAPQTADKFTLCFGASRAGRQCEILWRGRHLVGVKFLTQTKRLESGE
jgi:hypothetical protein